MTSQTPEGSTSTEYRENYCDIVMKGGITSGIVYPKAIAELAKHYRLKNIGGTSAGAIAACLAAAAEYRRSKTCSDAGYQVIRDLAEELQSPPECAPKKGFSTLFGLFQPSEKTSPLFKILESTLNQENRKDRLFEAIKAAILAYRELAAPMFLAGLVVGILFLAFVQSLSSCFILGTWLLAAPLALGFVLFVTIYPFWRFTLRDWKTEFPLSAAVLVVTAYFAPPVMCAVAIMPALALGALLAIGTAGFKIYRLLIDIANDDSHGFGLCTGMPPRDQGSHVAREYEGYMTLTPWLYEKIQIAAGKMGVDDAPLTFGDLEGAEGFPPTWMKEPPKSFKSINLQLVTTNLTHGRPYLLPFDDKHTRLFFKREELEPYFPEKIVDFLYEKSNPYKPENGYPVASGDIRELPAAKDLPVIFAARLSLSFPGLLSAIPLYAIDYEPKKSADRKLERCWFSDGGISSNFPIHFFDGFLPIWPTFGFTLEEKLKHWPGGEIFMPEYNMGGRGEAWNRFHDKKDFERMTGFITSILNAMQNWNDNTLTRMPGVRERVVRIYLDSEKEGGLNLNMDKEIVGKLAERGKEAAQEIIDRYVDKRIAGMDLENHMWVRLNTFVDMFGAHIPELRRALSTGIPGVNYHNQIKNAAARNKDQYPLSRRNIASVRAFIKILSQIKARTASGDIVLDKVRPIPKGALRGRPLL